MQQNNTTANVKELIVRAAPITHAPILFLVSTRSNGQLQAVVDHSIKTVGKDFYDACEEMNRDEAQAVLNAYAKKEGVDPASYHLRTRLPSLQPRKSGPRKQRATNDANLVLVKGEGKKKDEAPNPQDYRSKQEREQPQDLTSVVQNMHDTETKKHVDNKATEDNPHGARVKSGTRRKYEKQTEAKSKRSAAALARYHRDLQSAIENSPIDLKQHEVESGVSEAETDEAMLKFALNLVKLMKEHKVM